MKKDPAFLFYSKDFYEGTRMMLPEERACYMDLLIYQHQNGIIPNDIKRVLMYCSGVSEATLIATLQAKFKQTLNGWENVRLNNAIQERDNYKKHQSDSGKVGQFWKKAKQILLKKDYEILQKTLTNKEDIINLINENNPLKETLEGLLKHRLSNKANGNANVNEDEEKEKEGKGEKTVLEKKFDEFIKFRKAKKEPVLPESVPALKKRLWKLAREDEATAIEIIEQSIANGWTGIFKLDEQKNGKQTVTDHNRQAFQNVFNKIKAQERE